MRTHLPVTNRRFTSQDGTTLMSTTVVSSDIACANAAFIHVGGFDVDEITGQPYLALRDDCCTRSSTSVPLAVFAMAVLAQWKPRPSFQFSRSLHVGVCRESK